MELLLNFVWLMLALPALAVWRRHLDSSRGSGRLHHSRSLLLLGCLLVLLFPAVSASDDLHPISAEIEESGPFKRTIKQSPGAKSPAPTHHVSWAALPTPTAFFRPATLAVAEAPLHVYVRPQQILFSPVNGRAPPQA
jgi:hypothetical protein